MNQWSLMELDERAILILEMFPDIETQDILSEWSQNEYEDSWQGHQQSIADLLSMCRWESMSPKQREQERSRLTG